MALVDSAGSSHCKITQVLIFACVFEFVDGSHFDNALGDVYVPRVRKARVVAVVDHVSASVNPDG